MGDEMDVADDGPEEWRRVCVWFIIGAVRCRIPDWCTLLAIENTAGVHYM